MYSWHGNEIQICKTFFFMYLKKEATSGKWLCPVFSQLNYVISVLLTHFEIYLKDTKTGKKKVNVDPSGLSKHNIFLYIMSIGQ